MNGLLNIVILLLACRVATPSLYAATNTIGLAWNPAGANLTYRLFIGTSPGNYQRQLNYSSTNAWLPVDLLSIGTNYLAVSSVLLVNTNLAIASGYSAEAQIVRIPPPAPLQITIADPLLTSTNLVVWTVLSNEFTLAITPDQPAQFYRPNPGARLRLAHTPDTITISPTSPIPPLLP